MALQLQVEWKSITPYTLNIGHIRLLIESWKEHLSPMTIYQRRAALERFLEYTDHIHHTDHAHDVPKVARPSQRTLIAQEDELRRVLDVVPLWMKAFILMCRLMGLRHGEAAEMTPANYNLADHTLAFKRKMGGTSHIPVPAELQPAIELARSMDPHESILVSLGMKKTDDPRKLIGRRWREAVKKAKANPNLHIHDLRRTVATELYSHTKDLRAVQTLLGHRSLSSTILYIAPMDPDKLRSLMEEMKPAFNLSAMKLPTETPQ